MNGRLMASLLTCGLLPAICASPAHSGATAGPQGRVLREVVDALSPQLDATVLSALCVRTYYFPQAIGDQGEPRIRRTTVSEVLVNSGMVRESLSDTRLVRSELLSGAERTKHFAFHYADDGSYLRAYDGKWNAGAIRSSPQTQDRNFLRHFLDPLAAGSENKFISRAIPSTCARLRHAVATTETRKGDATCIDGEYREGDPERFFSMTVMHAPGVFVREMREYDKDKRILSEMTSEGTAGIQCSSCTLVLPKTTVVKKYRYDDADGNSCQTTILDILEPEERPIDPQKFSFRFPQGARVFDMGVALYSDQVQSIGLSATRDLLDFDAALGGAGAGHRGVAVGASRGPGEEQTRAGAETDTLHRAENQAVANQGDPITADPTGSALMARAREAYARDAQDRSGRASDSGEERTLRLPAPTFGWVLVRKATMVILIVGVLALGVRFAYQKILRSERG